MANIKDYIQLFDENIVLQNKIEKLEQIIAVLKGLVNEIGHFQPRVTEECLKEVDRIETSK